MPTLRIALLQMNACGNDQAANQAKGEQFCRRAQELGADIALLPEMWNIGYTPFLPPAAGPSDVWRAPQRWSLGQRPFPADLDALRAAWQAQAIGVDDPFLQHFRQLARTLQMAIAIPYLERWPGAPRNSVSLVDRHGELAFTYAKVHTCDFDIMESACTPGEAFHVAALDTTAGEVRVGAMICYDREFPESARLLMLQGAEIILVPNACTAEANRLGQLRARAYENMLGVAMTNYAAPQENGHSVAYMPPMWGAGGIAPDPTLVEAGGEEGVYLAAFDLEALRACRAAEVWGNAFRRPHRYGALTETTIAPPFVRVNAQGERYDPSQR